MHHDAKNLSKSWNMACQLLNTFPVVLILNNDLEILRGGLKNLVFYMEQNQETQFVSATEVNNPNVAFSFAAFAIRKELYDKVGPFDEHFVFKFGDRDYMKRVENEKCSKVRLDSFHVFHYRDMTGKKFDKSVYLERDAQAVDYYERKWNEAPISYPELFEYMVRRSQPQYEKIKPGE